MIVSNLLTKKSLSHQLTIKYVLNTMFIATMAIVTPSFGNNTHSEDENASPNRLKEFQEKIISKGMQFTMPKDYIVVEPKENEQMYYLFAMRNSMKDVEVRYALYPITKGDIERHQKCTADPDCSSSEPNHSYRSLLMANIMNLTGGKVNAFADFDPKWVNKQLNADKASFSGYFEFDSGFGKGYKYGHIFIFNKNNIANVAVVFLSNNKKTLSEERQKTYKQLTFKNK